MSTDRKKKKKRGLPRIERIKIIEYVCIGLVILLFLGLAIFYGGKKDDATRSEIEATPSPVPTNDPSIRGKNILDAIDGSSFSLTYRQDRYDLIAPNGVAIDMHMLSDDSGLRQLSFETALCADPEENNEIAETVRKENKQTLEALRDLLDLVMPVLRRTVSDSDTIVKQCRKTIETGEPYSKHIGQFTVRIETDPEAIPQAVTITFIHDP